MRYYRGKIKCRILAKEGNKAYIMYLGRGKVGNKKEGYKEVRIGDLDITMIRNCWKKRKEKKGGLE